MHGWRSGVIHTGCLPVSRSDEDSAGDAQYADFSGRWQGRLDVLLYFHWLSGLMFVRAAGVTARHLVRRPEQRSRRRSRSRAGAQRRLHLKLTPSSLIKAQIQHKCLMKTSSITAPNLHLTSGSFSCNLRFVFFYFPLSAYSHDEAPFPWISFSFRRLIHFKAH